MTYKEVYNTLTKEASLDKKALMGPLTLLRKNPGFIRNVFNTPAKKPNFFKRIFSSRQKLVNDTAAQKIENLVSRYGDRLPTAMKRLRQAQLPRAPKPGSLFESFGPTSSDKPGSWISSVLDPFGSKRDADTQLIDRLSRAIQNNPRAGYFTDAAKKLRTYKSDFRAWDPWMVDAAKKSRPYNPYRDATVTKLGTPDFKNDISSYPLASSGTIPHGWLQRKLWDTWLRRFI